jgi:hypothetical protein
VTKRDYFADLDEIIDSNHNILNMHKHDRREFVKRMYSLAVGTTLLPLALDAQGKWEAPKRVLGRTGERVSLLGMGGFHEGDPEVPDDMAIEIIRSSIDQGVNYNVQCLVP